ncbi:hypothetical protein HOY82DRAFT_599315 [Tuber indicum]|nr:hypothetical protein HOY82DRAFT_599315 [Tuber indicum]
MEEKSNRRERGGGFSGSAQSGYSTTGGYAQLALECRTVVEKILLDKERLREVEVSGVMFRMLLEEEERKAGWKNVTFDNKK